MAPLDMVEYIYFIEDDKSDSPIGTCKTLYQSKEREFTVPLESTVIIPSVIPSFTRRPAPTKAARKERLSIQEKIWDMAGTCVNWWHDPASLLSSFFVKPLQQSGVEPKSTSDKAPKGNLPLGNPIRRLERGAENPIQPVLKDSMETPAQARAKARRHSDYASPIRSELERDQGLSVILTDQFVPISYV